MQLMHGVWARLIKPMIPWPDYLDGLRFKIQITTAECETGRPDIKMNPRD